MEKNKVSTFTKIYSVIIILLPFLYQYASPLSFLSLGDFILLIFTCYGLLKLNFVLAAKYTKPILIFSAAFCVLTLFVSLFSIADYFEFSDSITIFLKILMYLCVCALCTQFFDLRYVKKIYLWLVRIFAVYLVIQVIYHAVSGGFLPIYLKHEWLFSWENRPANLTDYYVTGGYYRFRPSSLFLEPGYYALYVLPALFLLLFEDKKTIEAVLLYVTILFSTSGAGILIGGLAFALKFFAFIFRYKNGKIYFTPFTAVFVILLVGGVLYVLFFNEELMLKLFNSFNARVTRSLLIYDRVDVFHKIFGVGMNNTENYVNLYKIHTLFDEGNLNFGASLTATVVQYGIIGFAVFFCSLLALFVRARHSGMALLFVMLYIIYTAFEEVIFNFRMGFLLAFVFYYMVHAKQEISAREKTQVILKKEVRGQCE